MIRVMGLVVMSVMLMACSARPCKLEGSYLEAREWGDLVNPVNGELPPRDPAYEIPPIPDSSLSAERRYVGADGQEKSECIDRPPRLSAGSKS